MKRAPLFAVAAASFLGLAAFAAGGAIQGEKKGPAVVSADKAEFKEVMPGVSRATLWGDPEKGAYGAFTKFTPGFEAGVHTHSNDVRIVVLKGAYICKADGTETRVGPGSFFSIPGGTKHSSAGDPKEGALFYQEGSDKFDMTPVK